MQKETHHFFAQVVEEVDLGQELKNFEQAAITYKDELSRIEVRIAIVSHCSYPHFLDASNSTWQLALSRASP